MFRKNYIDPPLIDPFWTKFALLGNNVAWLETEVDILMAFRS